MKREVDITHRSAETPYAHAGGAHRPPANAALCCYGGKLGKHRWCALIFKNGVSHRCLHTKHPNGILTLAATVSTRLLEKAISMG